jgi:Mn2+/Fe2+ NRAMP family transporter
LICRRTLLAPIVTLFAPRANLGDDRRFSHVTAAFNGTTYAASIFLPSAVPAVIVAALYGERGTGELLVLSQVILSLQLSFAVIPLVMFTSDKVKMGRFVDPRWMTTLAWAVAVVIAVLNGYLLFQTGQAWFAS